MKNRSTLLDVAVDGVLLAIFFVISSVACYLLALIAALFVRQLANDIPEMVILLVKLPIHLIVTCVILAITAYKIGYLTIRGSMLSTLASAGIASVIYLPFCLFLSFSELVAGSGAVIASMIKIPLENIYGTLTVAEFLLISALATALIIPIYYVVFAPFRTIGANKRVAVRLQLERERNTNNEN